MGASQAVALSELLARRVLRDLGEGQVKKVPKKLFIRMGTFCGGFSLGSDHELFDLIDEKRVCKNCPTVRRYA